jgi:hypothetical protein
MKYNNKILEIGAWLANCSERMSLTKDATTRDLKKYLSVSRPKECRLNLLIFYMFLTDLFINKYFKDKNKLTELLDIYHVYITQTLTKDLKLSNEQMDMFQEMCNQRLKKYGDLRTELMNASEKQKGIKFSKYLVEVYKDINNSDEYDKKVIINQTKIISIEQPYLETLERIAKEKGYIQ